MAGMDRSMEHLALFRKAVVLVLGVVYGSYNMVYMVWQAWYG